MSATPDWLRAEVASGLQRLVALALPGQPPAETIALTAGAWCDVLAGMNVVWEQQQDAPRLRAAFEVLAMQVERWPAPTHYLRLMPPRVSPPELPWPKTPPAGVLDRIASLTRRFTTRQP